jgi:hypothetical protein
MWLIEIPLAQFSAPIQTGRKTSAPTRFTLLKVPRPMWVSGGEIASLFA